MHMSWNENLRLSTLLNWNILLSMKFYYDVNYCSVSTWLLFHNFKVPNVRDRFNYLKMLIFSSWEFWIFGECLLYTKPNQIYSAEIVSLTLFVNPTHSQSVPMHFIFNKMKFNREIKKEMNGVKFAKTWCQKVKKSLF